jgi:carbon monoxide dehydrogenase subunit G
MDIQGTRALAITQQQAWDALNDPEVLKACIAGCERMELTGDNQYAVGMAIKIGPVSAKFNGKITLSDINPPNSYTLAFDGQGGAAGFGKGKAQVTLVPAGSGCELQYNVTAQIGGKLAQVGQRLVDGAAKSMADDFFKRFEAEMAKRYPAPALAETAADRATEAVATAPASEAARPGPGMPIPAWVWFLAALGLMVAIYFVVKPT